MKKDNPNKLVGNNPNDVKEDRKSLQNLLIQRTEENVEQKFSDRKLDRENEKIMLISGAETSIRDIRDRYKILAASLQPYSPKFPREYYREINRLKGWTKEEFDIHHKPPIVARYTNELIYARFPKMVLPTLQHLNGFNELGIRPNKHFQWLTEQGKIELEGFIGDAIAEMKKSSSWHEFRVNYAKKHGLPYQLEMF